MSAPNDTSDRHMTEAQLVALLHDLAGAGARMTISVHATFPPTTIRWWISVVDVEKPESRELRISDLAAVEDLVARHGCEVAVNVEDRGLRIGRGSWAESLDVRREVPA